MTDNERIVEDISFDDLKDTFSFTLPNLEEEEVITPEVGSLTIGDTTEEEEEVIEDKPKVEAPKQVTSDNDGFYASLVKKNLEKGIWEDIIINDGEKEVKLSELGDITEEEYFNLIEDQKALKDEDLKDKFLPIEGVTEEKRIILEIVKNGGDLKEIFKEPSQLIKPFDSAQGWDLDNEEHQYGIVYQQYLAQGLTKERAKLLADADRQELVLDTKSKEIVDFHQKAYADKLKAVNDTLIEENKKEIERRKEYRQSLSKQYKEQNVPEPLTKKLLDLATKETEEGLAIDNIYFKLMDDPQTAQEIIFFLADKEKYLEQKLKESKIKQNTQTLRTINRIPRDREKVQTETETQKEGGFKFSI